MLQAVVPAMLCAACLPYGASVALPLQGTDVGIVNRDAPNLTDPNSLLHSSPLVGIIKMLAMEREEIHPILFPVRLSLKIYVVFALPFLFHRNSPGPLRHPVGASLSGN